MIFVPVSGNLLCFLEIKCRNVNGCACHECCDGIDQKNSITRIHQYCVAASYKNQKFRNQKIRTFFVQKSITESSKGGHEPADQAYVVRIPRSEYSNKLNDTTGGSYGRTKWLLKNEKFIYKSTE